MCRIEPQRQGVCPGMKGEIMIIGINLYRDRNFINGAVKQDPRFGYRLVKRTRNADDTAAIYHHLISPTHTGPVQMHRRVFAVQHGHKSHLIIIVILQTGLPAAVKTQRQSGQIFTDCRLRRGRHKSIAIFFGNKACGDIT